jgi:RimJ/RimL family protein N-acetyltransferase
VFGPCIQGERVALTTPRLEDMLLFPQWVADARVNRFLNLSNPPSEESERDYYAHMAVSPNDVAWSISVVEDGELRVIGNTGLHRINWRDRNAVSGIIIGVPEYWGQGIGGEVMRLRTRYAFEELGLEKVMTEIFLENEASRRAAMSAGYREVGIRRRHKWRAGRWHDLWLAEVLRDDWLALQSALPSAEPS